MLLLIKLLIFIRDNILKNNRNKLRELYSAQFEERSEKFCDIKKLSLKNKII